MVQASDYTAVKSGKLVRFEELKPVQWEERPGVRGISQR
jgi:hypothetical protein